MAVLNSLEVEGFVGFKQKLVWSNHSSINVIIGENDTCKTHLLKLLYGLHRAAEEFCLSQTASHFSDVLAQKLRTVFFPQNMELGKLVSRVPRSRLDVKLDFMQSGNITFDFGKDTTSKITKLYVHELPTLGSKKANFLPTKEVLSIMDAVIITREIHPIEAFDDTYYDLVKSLRLPTTSGGLSTSLSKARDDLMKVTGGGKIVIINAENKIWFERNKEHFNMHQTAEGIKKVGVFSQLMGNRRITKDSVLYIDEPEVNLHPRAIIEFANALHKIAESGVQIYLTTHSYFLLKRLEQLARQYNQDYNLLSLTKEEGSTGVIGSVTLLKDGLPEDNSIIEQSLALFDEDVNLAFPQTCDES
jgi:AAA15 family ATPase/GTPase